MRKALRVSALALGFAFGPLAPAMAQTGTVVLYGFAGAHNDGIAKAFEKKHPGIKVKVVSGGGPEILARLIAEKDRPQADVVDAQPESITQRPDLFEPYKSAEHASFPDWAVFKVGPNIMGYAYTILIQIIAANLKEIPEAQVPKSLKAMFDDKFKGKYQIADPSTSTAGADTATQVYAMYGEEGIARMVRNGDFTPATNVVPLNIGRGEVAMGVVEETKANELVVQDYPLKVFYQEEGLVPTYSVTALVKNRPNPENGKLLLEFINSREGHNINVETRNRRSPRSDVNLPKGLPPFSTLKINTSVSPEAMIDKRETAVELFKKYYATR